MRGCLRQPCWTPYRREALAPTLLDGERDWLGERVAQVHYSARILFQELHQRGFQGSYETVKLAVRPLRAAASVAALTQRRFETAPGEQAQVDWGQLTVQLASNRAKVHVLIMTLGYSRRAYAEGFLRERMSDLLAAHENAFAHFGGRCESLLYDRMRTVVLGTMSDADGRRPSCQTSCRLRFPAGQPHQRDISCPENFTPFTPPNSRSRRCSKPEAAERVHSPALPAN